MTSPVAPAAINISIRLGLRWKASTQSEVSANAIAPLVKVTGPYSSTLRHTTWGALYRWGLDVDASGSTAGGEKFRGIRRFRDLLLTQEEQVARNFVSQLITYATGAEVQFADRPR